ncbi:lysozyme inhibitor LprI family protein [Dyella sp.]|jgi:uncharacterized protein YecT (DUF1311 family)|uniref:lysozyme inhibitor LprI family protein n=1 Tax=Dyella sp. TaxID=1869338 RepID=UPI002D771715|nr:lysozyme inhibitor LprI family protein [Dyella sp.]HET6433812.1 lysozyme inhibitor LprI family protein [Dyella sp.]
MRRRIVVWLLVAAPAAAPGVYAGEAPGDCRAEQTQAGLNACAGAGFAQADAELNRVWRAIVAKYADQPLFLARLKTAQRAWLAFRDTELGARFPLAPGQQAGVQYGSAFPMCESQQKARLTEQRTAQLRAWLDGVEEGDVCSGSIKHKDTLQ